MHHGIHSGAIREERPNNMMYAIIALSTMLAISLVSLAVMGRLWCQDKADLDQAMGVLIKAGTVKAEQILSEQARINRALFPMPHPPGPTNKPS